jgi:hypothetical protein
MSALYGPGPTVPAMGKLDPGHLLWKACHLHGLAESMSDSWHKKALHEIAQIYELLADETVNGESRAGRRPAGN